MEGGMVRVRVRLSVVFFFPGRKAFFQRCVLGLGILECRDGRCTYFFC
jgi:hypothetical protein